MTNSANNQTAVQTSTIGSKIKKLRKSKGMTQIELGRKIGVTGATINKYETGIVVNLRRPTIEKLAIALGTSPAELMGWTSDNTASSAVSTNPERLSRFATLNRGKRHIGSENFVPTVHLRAVASKEEQELLRIFGKLSVKQRMELLKYAMELENESAE